MLAIHDAQQVAGGEEPDGGLTNIILGDQLLGQGGEQAAVGAAAVQVGARFQSGGTGLGGGIGIVVVGVEIIDCPAVGNHVALEAPFFPQVILQQLRAAAAGVAVDGVIRAHDRFHMALFDGGLKGGEVGLLHVLLGGVDIKGVPLGLRAGVNGKVLGAGSGL